MRVTALDLSLTGTGVAKHGGRVTTTRRITSKPSERYPRLIRLRDEILPECMGSDIVAIEDYAHGPARDVIAQTAELHSQVMVGLVQLGIPWVRITPASVKKYATGKGDAKKEDMKLAAYKRFRLEFRSNDECDAFLLLAMTLHHYGHPLCEMPQSHLKAFKKVEWPVLASGAE